jgi:hypothetical protein
MQMGERDKQAFIDDSLEKVLRAAGSSLRYYTMQKSRDDLRNAMREVIAAARTQGSE